MADTKQIIADGLLSLLEKKSIESITVKSLVEYCHVSRQTFYYHFRDIMDVLEWGINQGVKEALADCLNEKSTHGAIEIFVDQVMKKRSGIRKFLTGQRRQEFELLVSDAFRVYLRELFRREMPEPRLPFSDLEALLDFYTYGAVGLILKNCMDKQADASVLADQICRLLSGEMLDAARAGNG